MSEPTSATRAGGVTPGGPLDRAVLTTSRKLRVDVVIPCYNYGHFLPACVRSVLDQPGVDVRALVIDDRSTDNSPAVIDELTATDNRVLARLHTVNKGHIATYNEGLLEWADSDLVVLLSADDLLAPGALGRAAALFQANQSVGMVYGRGVYYQDHDHLPRTASIDLGSKIWSGADWIEGRCRTAKNVISSPEVVVRTDVQREVGGYRPDLPHAGDLEMWLRVAAVSDVAYVRGRPQAYYRVHDQSMLRQNYSSFLSDFVQRRAVFERYVTDHRGVLPNADRLLDSARRGLARDALWAACCAYDRNELEEMQADDLVAFALETYPESEDLSEYRALRRRRRLGADLCSRTRLFIGSRAARRGLERARLESWKWRGV